MNRLLPELAVGATLLVSFLTIPLPLPHVASAAAWAALTCVHVARRRRIYLVLLRRAHYREIRWPRVAATTMLIVCAAVVTLSGLVQQAGVAAAIPWHGGSSVLLIVIVTAHAVPRLWRLRRLRRRGRRSPAAR